MSIEGDSDSDDLDDIRATYARYERSGRSGLWDLGNTGYRRLILERDAALDLLISDCVQASEPVASIPKLIDVGCGTGQLAMRLHAIHPEVEVTGVDLLAERFELARS